MLEIVFASKNEHKLTEVRSILENDFIKVYSMQEFVTDLEIIEDGNTFEENATKKAETVCRATNKIALADDSGLAIDFLNGEPGIYSARYMGENTPSHVKNEKILELMKDVKKRNAHFTTAMALVFPDGNKFIEVGILKGMIADKIYGENGFGYDPIFYIPEYKMTTAQMSPEMKNKISHRRKALELIKKRLHELYPNM